MRAIVGPEGMGRPAASTSQMGRFEAEWLPSEANLAELANLSGTRIDRVHERRPPNGIILDMDSSDVAVRFQLAEGAWRRPPQSGMGATSGCRCGPPDPGTLASGLNETDDSLSAATVLRSGDARGDQL